MAHTTYNNYYYCAIFKQSAKMLSLKNRLNIKSGGNKIVVVMPTLAITQMKV